MKVTSTVRMEAARTTVLLVLDAVSLPALLIVLGTCYRRRPVLEALEGWGVSLQMRAETHRSRARI